MDADIKRAILYGSGLLGFFQEEKNFTGMNVVVERKKLLHALMVFGGKIGLNAKEKEMDKLVKYIETGKINVEIVENFEKIQNKKRMSKYTGSVANLFIFPPFPYFSLTYYTYKAYLLDFVTPTMVVFPYLIFRNSFFSWKIWNDLL